MAWTQETINVGTSATKIAPTTGTNVGAKKVVFRTHASNATYLGGSDVATSTGVQLKVDEVYELDLSDGAPYLVSGTAHDVNFAFGESRK